jgi:hypothetical protein
MHSHSAASTSMADCCFVATDSAAIGHHHGAAGSNAHRGTTGCFATVIPAPMESSACRAVPVMFHLGLGEDYRSGQERGWSARCQCWCEGLVQSGGRRRGGCAGGLLGWARAGFDAVAVGDILRRCGVAGCHGVDGARRGALPGHPPRTVRAAIRRVLQRAVRREQQLRKRTTLGRWPTGGRGYRRWVGFRRAGYVDRQEVRLVSGHARPVDHNRPAP